MKKRSQRPARRKPRAVVLDAFTHEQLEEGAGRGVDIQALSDRVYFELERQRAARHDDLCAALRSFPGISLDLHGWSRVTDWRWSQTPLSAEGSLKNIGGRFNIGADLDRARGQSFRALYVAEDVDTAYSEYFGGRLSLASGALTLGEFALRRETSFTTFLLSGQVDEILDIRTMPAISAFADIIKDFTVSADTRSALRRAKLQPRYAVTSSAELYRALLAPPKEWRLEPQALGIPASSQIFGRFARDSGFEGILFPSRIGVGLNLALFPENFRGSASRVEVVGSTPAGATSTVLDATHV